MLTVFRRSSLSIDEEATEEDWICKIIELLSLDKRSIFDRLLRRGAKYEYLPVLGGILLHIKGQGVVWLPKPYIEGLLSKAGISSTMMHNASLVFSLTVPGGSFIGLTYNFIKDRVWKEPPTETRQYLPRMIDRVEYGSFTSNSWKTVTKSLQQIVKIIGKRGKTGEDAPFCIHFIRFFDKIAMAKESEKRTTLESFAYSIVNRFQMIPTYRCMDEKKLLKFIEKLGKDGFKVMKLS